MSVTDIITKETHLVCMFSFLSQHCKEHHVDLAVRVIDLALIPELSDRYRSRRLRLPRLVLS